MPACCNSNCCASASDCATASLKKTCQKQEVSFWGYLMDRLTLTHAIPSLHGIVCGNGVPMPLAQWFCLNARAGLILRLPRNRNSPLRPKKRLLTSWLKPGRMRCGSQVRSIVCEENVTGVRRTSLQGVIFISSLMPSRKEGIRRTSPRKLENHHSR